MERYAGVMGVCSGGLGEVGGGGLRALPVYPVFEEENSNGSDEKSVIKRKIALKKTTGLI